VGTVSIEKSELLSKMLKLKGVKHTVLNAKYHEKEAEIVAQAGKLGAVTIATNMAGRGTDIILGGNAEFSARAEMRKQGIEEDLINEAVGYAETDNEEVLNARKIYIDRYNKYSAVVKEKAVAVKEAGGLVIIGTERHEARRIDNQLRGRSGRQGDEGESCFFLSVEDDLMRIFAGDRLERMMATFNVEENMPIESKLLTRIIESSQKKVEGRNFSIRKSVLSFDDVMNSQREIIYKERAQVLAGEDMHEYILKMIGDLMDSTVNEYITNDDDKEAWNLVGLREFFRGWITDDEDLNYTEDELDETSKEMLIETLTEKAKTKYRKKEEEVGSEVIRELERMILLRVVDTKWMAHIDDMDELKKGIGLRAYGQKNPVIEFRYEGFEMFDEMVKAIRLDTVRMLMSFKIAQRPQFVPMETTQVQGG
jgi:preprotein translocase subunit SecA